MFSVESRPPASPEPAPTRARRPAPFAAVMMSLCCVLALACVEKPKTSGLMEGDGGAGGPPPTGEGGAGGAANGAAGGAPPSPCGDGVVQSGESCDDGNRVGGDGCSSTCAREPHYTCPTAGHPCVHDVVCGDGIVEATEQCDDGNTTNNDGCSSTCTLECRRSCTGATCTAVCGDGAVEGTEQCDDGNTTAGDGCSPTCAWEHRAASMAEGWSCSTPKGTDGCIGPTVCVVTTCGNGVVEGTEQCDDGNSTTGDGCSPTCRLEPVCPPAGGPCSTVCGSGTLLSGDDKGCDDGNRVDGDGCSSSCTIETGYACKPVPINPNPLFLPVVYHDFQSWMDPNGHPDFEHYFGDGQAGIVEPKLSAAGVPVHVGACVPMTSNLCVPPAGATPPWDPKVDWFGMWYVDTPAYNKTIVQTLQLPKLADGSFQFSNDAFFPLDGVPGTWGTTPGLGHDYGFTSIVRYWFQYDGTATLTFAGDDDVFVFINKVLAVDLGGPHQHTQGSITLDAVDGTGYACDFVAPGPAGGACDTNRKTGGHSVSLGLARGSVYEIAVFQAERHSVDSHYRLTLDSLTSSTSVCANVCGDGIVVPPEQCDLGAEHNTGAPGGCKPDCTRAAQ